MRVLLLLATGLREQQESGGPPINFAYHMEEGGVAESALTSHMAK